MKYMNQWEQIVGQVIVRASNARMVCFYFDDINDNDMVLQVETTSEACVDLMDAETDEWLSPEALVGKRIQWVRVLFHDVDFRGDNRIEIGLVPGPNIYLIAEDGFSSMRIT